MDRGRQARRAAVSEESAELAHDHLNAVGLRVAAPVRAVSHRDGLPRWPRGCERRSLDRDDIHSRTGTIRRANSATLLFNTFRDLRIVTFLSQFVSHECVVTFLFVAEVLPLRF